MLTIPLNTAVPQFLNRLLNTCKMLLLLSKISYFRRNVFLMQTGLNLYCFLVIGVDHKISLQGLLFREVK